MLKEANNNELNIDGITINKELMESILLKENAKKESLIDDLSNINPKSERELLEIIRHMMENKTFFKYCYSLLININPGPDYVYDYLNLKEWITKGNENSNNNNNDNKSNNDPKPHLYSYMQYVYESMISENKSQVVSLLGPLGSGKTFNLIHIMEYFVILYSYKDCNIDNFELIHKSIQFVHILGSIFRENNLESTSCGLLLSLEFNQNNLICNFDIEAQILDYTLPFNEKGRTFTIFHALIRGANTDLKKMTRISLNDENLFNLKKNKKNQFYANDKEKEKFKLNDFEIWNRFYSLMKYFNFTKKEMLDIVNCFAFILNTNELLIHKCKGGKLKNIDLYEIQPGITTKKLCKNLGIITDDKIGQFEKKIRDFKFKSLQEAEIFIQGLMKQTYYIVFEYVLQKIKSYISEYFSKINTNYNLNNKKPKNTNNKFIYFIDFPGEGEDRNLGGFTTNIAHECLNMYSASVYYEIVEKILLENIIIKKFKPLKSYSLLSNCFNIGGILDNLEKPLTKDNFDSMKKNIIDNLNLYNCYRFFEPRKANGVDYNIFCSFSDKNVAYNYEYLYYESKSLLYNQKIYNIFSLANNIIISSIYKNNQTKLHSLNNFYNFYISSLQKFFKPIKNYKPFVIYCLHSSDSYKYFFPKKDKKHFNSEISLDIIKHSMIPPILNWNWHGFKEWIKVDDFINEYGSDFEKVKNRIILINNSDPNKNKFDENNLDYNSLCNRDKAKCILNILARDFDYILGNDYIIMKSGTLKRISIYLNSMIDTSEKMSKNLIDKIKKSNENNNTNDNNNSNDVQITNNSKKPQNKNGNNKRKSFNKNGQKENGATDENIVKKDSFALNLEKFPLPMKKSIKYLEDNIYKEKPDNQNENLLKEKCTVDIISSNNNGLKLLNKDEKNNILKSKFLNVDNILNKNLLDNSKIEEIINNKDVQTRRNIPSKNNTVVSDPIIFNKIKNLFDPSKTKNIKLFDYSENADQIIKIQTFIRNLNAKKKCKILKYLTTNVILAQRFIRGLLSRKNFKFFMKCSKYVYIIQRLYKKRYKKLNESAKKIQDYYRKKKKSRKERDKIILKKKLEAEKEKYSYIDVDKYVDNVMKNKNEEEIHKIISNIGKHNEANENNKAEDSNINDKVGKNNADIHRDQGNDSGGGRIENNVIKGSSGGVDDKNKDKKDIIDKKDIKEKKDIKDKKGKIGKIGKKGISHKINATNELINETNKDKIIDLLLYSHLPYDEKVYRKRLKRSKSDYYKIEDKLLHEGEQMKKNKEKKNFRIS